MFYAYVLKSEVTGKHYFGSCENLEIRLKTHNVGKVKYTKPFRPWRMIYTEEFATRSEAFRREQFFKTKEGREYLQSRNVL